MPSKKKEAEKKAINVAKPASKEAVVKNQIIKKEDIKKNMKDTRLPDKKIAAKAVGGKKTSPKPASVVKGAVKTTVKPAAPKVAASKPVVSPASGPVVKSVVARANKKVTAPTAKPVVAPTVKSVTAPAAKPMVAPALKPAKKTANKQSTSEKLKAAVTEDANKEQGVKIIIVPEKKSGKIIPDEKKIEEDKEREFIQELRVTHPEIRNMQSVRYSDEELNMFRERLNEVRKEALEELGMLKERLEDLTNYDFAEESMIYSMHMAEQGSEAMEKEKTYAQIQRLNEYLKKLDEALQRVHDKTYGFCRVCGCLIAKERLLAVPITTLSASYKIHKKCPEDGVDRIEPIK